MALLEDLMEKVEELVNFELNKGVSPIELASSIYEDGYTEVKIKKQFGHVTCTVQFYDNEFFNEQKIKHEYRYIYDENNYLQEIELIKNKKVEILWSRTVERTNILNNILEMAKGTDHVKLRNFAFDDRLPEQVRTSLKSALDV
ncbi:hypothetical protein [Brevibacillus reuszeri]|uniref:hypothetical protein n=1 Tax=Brevibacillus reuszeri TaxID=54915 RepID=UPI003D1F756C